MARRGHGMTLWSLVTHRWIVAEVTEGIGVGWISEVRGGIYNFGYGNSPNLVKGFLESADELPDPRYQASCRRGLQFGLPPILFGQRTISVAHPLPRLGQVFRQDAGLCHGRHEVCVAQPARESMQVEMARNPCACGFAEVHAEVQAMWP